MRLRAVIGMGLMLALAVCVGGGVSARADENHDPFHAHPAKIFALPPLKDPSPLTGGGVDPVMHRIDHDAGVLSVPLPPDWVRTDQSSQDQHANADAAVVMGKRLPRLRAAFASPQTEGLQSSLSIYDVSLTQPMTARVWLLLDAKAKSIVLRGLSVDPAQDRATAEYLRYEGERVALVRVRADRTADRVTIIEAVIPEKRLSVDHAPLTHALAAADYAHSADRPYPVAAQAQHAFLSAALFSYPKEWVLHAPSVRDPKHMQASLTFQEYIKTKRHERDIEIATQSLSGTIAIDLYERASAPSLQNILHTLSANVQKSGFVAGDRLVTTRFATDSTLPFQQNDVYELRDPAGKLFAQEWWVSILASPHYLVVITLQAPSPDSDLAAWARYTDAYRRIVESFRLL